MADLNRVSLFRGVCSGQQLLTQSRTIARSFSAALNEAFMIDNSLDGLSQAVEQKCAYISPADVSPRPLRVSPVYVGRN